jgi:hypothetical protein
MVGIVGRAIKVTFLGVPALIIPKLMVGFFQ